MADINLFPRLQRLFSSNVVVRNIGGNQLKVIDTNRIQSFGDVQTNSLIDRFTRIHRSGLYSVYPTSLNYITMRTQLYTDYEAMDTDPLCASALDIVADECTLKNEAGEILQIKSSDENVQRILYNLFYDVLNIEFNLWSWARSMCKYGDYYLYLEIAEKFGIYNVTPMAPYDITREEGNDPENPSKVTFKYDPGSVVGGFVNPTTFGRKSFENYEIAHFRLLSDSNFLPYGRSFYEPARKVYKQYTLMKDSMMIHRVMRAPERRIFYIDIANIPPHEVDTYMKKVVDKMKKTPLVDQATGEYNLKYNVMNQLEDFYLPVRGQNSNSKIETLPGLQNDAIDDVQFLRDEMLAALKIPKAYFGLDANMSGKSTLSSEDMRFSHTIERIQRILISELTKIALVHLYVQGYEGESLVNFELSLTTSSIVYELEKVNLWKEKIALARDVLETGLLPSDWIYDYVFQFSESKYDEFRDLVIEDKKRMFRLSQIENEGNDPSISGQSFGTPHDLASLYGKGRQGHGTDTNVPEGYAEDINMGRPQELASNYSTQKDALGRNPLGKKDDYINEIKSSYKGTTPLRMEMMMREIKKKMNVAHDPGKDRSVKMLYEHLVTQPTLLDEDQIKGI